MSDGILAAIIAAAATVFASFVQLRTSAGKHFHLPAAAAPSRRKSRFPLYMLLMAVLGASVGGFAFAQWLYEGESAAHAALERDLNARIADLTRTNGELEQVRAATHAELEAEVRRRLGDDGVAVLATVAPCTPPRANAVPAAAASAAPARLIAPARAVKPVAPASGVAAQQPTAVQTGGAGCAEADAAPLTLCATIPAAAKTTGVDLYVRDADPNAAWTAATAGHEAAQARFAEKSTESPEDSASKQVCEGFVQWSGRARVARMIVHYTL